MQAHPFSARSAGNEDSEQREKGYRQSLKKHNLPFDPCLVVRGGFEPNQAHAAAVQLIAAGLEFDAIFTGDDDNAVGVIQALREAGRDIPADVAVVGFDDSLFARILTPLSHRARPHRAGWTGSRPAATAPDPCGTGGSASRPSDRIDHSPILWLFSMIQKGVTRRPVAHLPPVVLK